MTKTTQSSPIRSLRHTYAYSLGRKTGICPSCHRRRFKFYVDASGRILDPTVGRCNREFSCGYHLTPRQWQASGGALPKPPARHPVSAHANRYSCMPRAWVDRSRRPDYMSMSSLYTWFCHRFGTQLTDTVFGIYSTGGSRLMGGSALFWYIDGQGMVRTAKAVPYRADGHRNRNTPFPALFIHSRLRDFHMQGCFFGANVLSRRPKATAIIVESEKTALYLACRLGVKRLSRYVPIATGGKCGLGFDAGLLDWQSGYKWVDMLRRRMILLPDSDATDSWRTMAVQLRTDSRLSHLRVVDLRRYGAAGSDDIMDLLERSSPVPVPP